MKAKILTLRKISTGGTLLIKAQSLSHVVTRLHLDPNDWEEVISGEENKDTDSGDSSGDARPENN